MLAKIQFDDSLASRDLHLVNVFVEFENNQNVIYLLDIAIHLSQYLLETVVRLIYAERKYSMTTIAANAQFGQNIGDTSGNRCQPSRHHWQSVDWTDGLNREPIGEALTAVEVLTRHQLDRVLKDIATNAANQFFVHTVDEQIQIKAHLEATDNRSK